MSYLFVVLLVSLWLSTLAVAHGTNLPSVEQLLQPQLLQQLRQLSHRPQVAIIIDDLGDNLREGQQAIGLPGALTYAILPHTPHAEALAILAHCSNKEVMLHQPMEALNGKRMGPGGIDSAMDRTTMLNTLQQNLRSVPYARGVNNHMGSRLTSSEASMEQFMQLLAQLRPQLYFIDSRTTADTVALLSAKRHQIASTRRNIFLDHTPTEGAITQQFMRLIAHLAREGSAIAIGHTYPQTTAALKQLLPLLDYLGIELVATSRLIETQQRRDPLWQASLSRSPPAANSLKPSP